MIQIIEDFLKTRNIRIHYKYFITEPKNPTFVVFPGGPGFGYGMYESRVMPFTHYVNILLFDPRGCGLSSKSKNANAYSLENNIKDARALLKKLRLKNIIVHGTSYGTMVALGFTLQYPDLVDQLILVSGSPSYDFFDLAKEQLAKRGDEEQQDICAKYLWTGKFTEETLTEYFRQMASLYSYKTKQKIINIPFKCNADVLNQAFKSSFGYFDFTSELKKILCPTLILSGKHDWINPPILAEIMHKGIINSKLIIFEEAGHSIANDVPEQYTSAIIQFIKDLSY